MKVTELALMGLNHTRNAVAEAVYLKTGFDMTKPVTFHALVNERCNCKCRHCEYWRQAEYIPELSIEQWKTTLLSIKEFTGHFSINFSGGEPFIKKGFIDLLHFCREHDILAGVTTNGALLNEKNSANLVAARPFNLNISCDSHIPEIHDYVRGMNGLFRKISGGIALLKKEQARQNITFPIIIKPTIMSLNFRTLPDIVQWALDVGATAVNFQPLGRWTRETYDELWIEENDWPELERVMEKLIAMKRAGSPIMNSEEILHLMTASFREEKASPENMPCRIGLQEFYIRPDGEVKLCFHFPGIGNTTRQSAKEIWRGAQAKKIRDATIGCDKLCLLTCLSQKSLLNKVNQAITILLRQKKQATISESGI
ncbi:MAG: radical SAM protein [Chlorobium sp.]|jgi:MoaA/NifB/PqqE/SkfB family radical SAM enzyme|nr:radical SAM protein [Chlorobium sp.]